MGPDREAHRQEGRGGEPAFRARPSLDDEQARQGEQRPLPVPLRGVGVVQVQVGREDGREPDQARQCPPQAPAAPACEQPAQGQEEGGVEREDRPGPAPAEELAQAVGAVDLPGEVEDDDVAIGANPRIPPLGDRRPGVQVGPPGPEQVMGQPGGDHGGRDPRHEQAERPAQEGPGRPLDLALGFAIVHDRPREVGGPHRCVRRVEPADSPPSCFITEGGLRRRIAGKPGESRAACGAIR